MTGVFTVVCAELGDMNDEICVPFFHISSLEGWPDVARRSKYTQKKKTNRDKRISMESAGSLGSLGGAHEHRLCL